MALRFSTAVLCVRGGMKCNEASLQKSVRLQNTGAESSPCHGCRAGPLWGCRARPLSVCWARTPVRETVTVPCHGCWAWPLPGELGLAPARAAALLRAPLAAPSRNRHTEYRTKQRRCRRCKAPVTTATGRPAPPLPLAEAPVSQAASAARPCGGAARRAFLLRRCGGVYLYVEVGGVEAPGRDEPGLGRPQVPRHQLAGPLHQELAVPLRRHLAPGSAAGRRACATLPRGGLSRSSLSPALAARGGGGARPPPFWKRSGGRAPSAGGAVPPGCRCSVSLPSAALSVPGCVFSVVAAGLEIERGKEPGVARGRVG